METVAVLGTGLLGSGFVEGFRKRGVAVRVWNRTIAKAQALEAVGAVVADDPADAARGASRVHLVLSDDESVDVVVEEVLAGLDGTNKPPIVDHSTLLPARVARRVAELAERGITYLHAPVFMGPPNARDATGLMLVSGPDAIVEPLLPALTAMTGKVLRLGNRPEVAAAYKLMGNSALVTLVAASSDVLAIARATGIDGKEALSLFSHFDPTMVFKTRAVRIANEEWSPASFEVTMARKDVGLMLKTAGHDALIALPAIAERLDGLIEAGHGSEDLAALGRKRQ